MWTFDDYVNTILVRSYVQLFAPLCMFYTIVPSYIICVKRLLRGELPGFDQLLDRTSAVYSMLLYTVASAIAYVIHQWHFG